MRYRHPLFWAILAIFTLLFAFFFIFNNRTKTPKNSITLSELKDAKKKIQLQVFRYEKDLFSLDINNLKEEVKRLSQVYPPFLIEPDIWNDCEMMESLKAYLKDTIIMNIYHVAEKEVNFDEILSQLETAFGYYKVLYPEDSIPKIITLIPGIDMSTPSIYLYEEFLYVNIDMYLGEGNYYYDAFGLPKYMSERCTPEYLPLDVFKKAVVYKHLVKVQNHTLLDAMITEGKKLYFTEMMFPNVNERIIIGYSEVKYDWAVNFTGNAWSYLIEKNELFGKGETLFRGYIEEAPFTKTFGNDSPGRMGVFLGWKLVQSFMKNNPEVTLPELMQETDYQKILNISKYKPQPK